MLFIYQDTCMLVDEIRKVEIVTVAQLLWTAMSKVQMILQIVHKLIMTGFKRSPIIQMRPFCTLYNFIS